MIDRLSPCERPHTPLIGYQKWQKLLFVHWEVEISTLRELVPAYLELDLYEGRALVGVVPFYMEGVRPSWAPSWSAFNFHELNLRTYVIHNGEPGVYFFSLDAASWIAVCAARLGWSLPYFPARFQVEHSEDRVSYHTHRILPKSAYFEVEYQIGDWLGASSADTIEHFLLERYLLFTVRRGHLYRGQVHHTPYPAQEASMISCRSNLLEMAGLTPTQETPAYVHYAKGVDVEIFAMKPI